MNPRFAWFHCNRGDVLKALKRYDEALAAYKKALELEPENEGYLDKVNGLRRK